MPSLRDIGSTSPVDWTLQRVATLPERAELELLGRVPVTSEASVALYADAGGYRLHYDDTGVFDVSGDGGTVLFAPGADPAPEKVEADVLGRVLAVALHAAGRLCLHGSAVALPTGAIAFLAPKHGGKSTLALAATRRGARLLTDDSLPVELASPPVAYPGAHGVRLWDDSLGRLAPDRVSAKAAGGKHVLRDLPAERLATAPVPLRTAYVLAPEPPRKAGAVVERQALPALAAAVALLRDGKIGALLGGREAPVLLERAAALACSVPVYVLRFARDYERLDAVVDQLLAWRERDAAAGSP